MASAPDGRKQPLTWRDRLREIDRARREGRLRALVSELIGAIRRPDTLGRLAAVSSGWLMAEQLIRMAIVFVITVLIIRHLGPAEFGVLAYGIAVISLIGIVATLGMQTIAVREIVNDPDEVNEVLGTTVLLRFLSSIAIAGLVLTFVWATEPDRATFNVLLVLTLGLPIWALSGLEAAFQARYQGQLVFYSKAAGVVTAAAIRVGLLFMGAPLIAFAVATAIEYAATGVFFSLVYRRRHAPLTSLRVTRSMARRLFVLSWPLLISGLALTIHLRVDQVMLLHIAGSAEVGVYAAGARISEVWYFIPIAVANAVMPLFVARYKEGRHAYQSALQRGFDVTAWIAIGIAVLITLAAPLVVLLYGEDFTRTVNILRVHIWAAPFLFMGTLLSRALVTEDRRKFELTRHTSGAVLNIVLNLILIPTWGALGAAVATVASYAYSSYFVCFAYRPAWDHARLMTRALFLPLRWRGSDDMNSQPPPPRDSPPEPPADPRDNGAHANGTHPTTASTPASTAARTASAVAEARTTIQVAEPAAPQRADDPRASVDHIVVPAVAEPSRGYFILKRTVDLTVSGMLLLLLAPLMIALAAAIKLTSPGPVLFKQQRCGLRAEPFRVFKFRSMRQDAEARMDEVRDLDITNGPTFKSPVDPRVTAVGRLMRRYSLDELPQLWHVFTGEMSLVGPRPLVIPETLSLPVWALGRLAAKPGLTCIWQVSGRSLIPFEEWMALDLEYVQRRSTSLDFKLLAQTPAAVLTGRGAF